MNRQTEVVSAGIRICPNIGFDWHLSSRRYPLAALTPGTLIEYQDRQRWTFPGISCVRAHRRLC
jgi:hypothetical protein